MSVSRVIYIARGSLLAPCGGDGVVTPLRVFRADAAGLCLNVDYIGADSHFGLNLIVIKMGMINKINI